MKVCGFVVFVLSSQQEKERERDNFLIRVKVFRKLILDVEELFALVY